MGITRQFTVTPNTGYMIQSASGCSGTLSGSTFTTGPVTANCSVSATFQQVFTVTASAGTGGSISPAGAVSVGMGITRQFTVTPNTGYIIQSASGCGGTLSGNTFTTGPATASCSVTATFQPVYTVTASASAGGTISPLGIATVPKGTTKQFTAIPNTDYMIQSVTGCGGTLSGNGTTFTTGPVTANCTVSATFQPVYTVTASASAGGTISPLGVVTASTGTTKQFTVIPNTDYMIQSVTGCGGTLAGNTFTTGSITANCTVAAVLIRQLYTISTSVSQGGTISPPGPVNVPAGTAKQFTVIPNTGYMIQSVTGCGGTLSGSTVTTGPVTPIAQQPGAVALSGNTFTTDPISANCTVGAAFVPQPRSYTISTSAGQGGTISPPGPVNVPAGTAKQFTAIPNNAGYMIQGVAGCGGTLSGNTFTTAPVYANCSVSATFRPVYTVTASASAGGTISPSGVATVPEGTIKQFTVLTAQGHVLQGVTGCGGTLSGNTYTTGPITSNCTVAALFY
jgi:uncharacterized protein (DUF779 family)